MKAYTSHQSDDKIREALMTSTFGEEGIASPFELRHDVTLEQITALLEDPLANMIRRQPHLKDVEWFEKPHYVLGPMTSLAFPTRPFGVYGAYKI